MAVAGERQIFGVDSRVLQMRISRACLNFPPACPHRYAQGTGMASYLEMDAVGRDRARFVSLAKQCLAFPDINEWERKFLDSLIRGNEMMGGSPEQLSLRQAETLLSIRDEYELHSELHRGF